MQSYRNLIDRELTAEHLAEDRILNEEQRNWLTSRGVSAAAMSSVLCPRSYRVQFDKDRFTPDPTGIQAIVFPCWRWPRLHDLVAWTPSQTATRLGRESILGFEALETWHDHLKPLAVFSSPLTWLVSGFEGIVILDRDAAWDLLRHFENFQAESLAHGQELERILQPQRRPINIQVPVMEAA